MKFRVPYSGFCSQNVSRTWKIVKDAFEKPRSASSINTKMAAWDLVTETDSAVEKFIVSNLSKAFPDHKFIGEEETSEGKKIVWTDAPTWMIDPIDGTTNFVHRIPFVAICVGLTVNRQMVAGIVYNPVRDELYTAQKGKGAFKNERPIKTSGETDIKKSICLVSNGEHSYEQFGEDFVTDVVVSNNKALFGRGLRQFGAMAINMCYIAEGIGDIAMEFGPHCWDFAASGMVLLEAGGALMDTTGGEFELMSRRILCGSTAELLSSVAPKLKSIPYPREAE